MEFAACAGVLGKGWIVWSDGMAVTNFSIWGVRWKDSRGFERSGACPTHRRGDKRLRTEKDESGKTVSKKISETKFPRKMSATLLGESLEFQRS